MDPGKCPECGTDVDADQLHATPYWVTRRRIIRKTLLIGLPLLLALTAYYILMETNWPAQLPTGMLLALQGGSESEVAQELWNRFTAGTLTQQQADRMFRNGLEFPDGLDIRTPHPAELPLLLSLPTRFRCPPTIRT